MNNIKYWRDYYGISQRWLARKTGISYAEMSYIESDTHVPNVYMAIELANALNVPVEKLFGSDGK
jgi:Predicted transcriptional regulators